MKNSGFSLTEILIGVIVSAIIFAGLYKMMSSTVRSSSGSMARGRMDQDLSRFAALVTSDIGRAGSDPTGNALRAYILQATCGGKILLKYGINAEPADAACTTSLGTIGILSYLPYDSNADGTIDPEEGLDMSSAAPALRTPLPNKNYPEDYVVYAFVDSDGDGVQDAVERRIVNDSSVNQTSLAKIVLKNVVSFDTKHYGFDQNGAYGEVTNTTRYNDIREVEISVMVRADKAEPGYSNPLLAVSSPYKSYRTQQITFRTSLIVRKG